MNYPCLSLKQDLIDEAFSNKKYEKIKKELKQTASPQSIRMKKIYKEQKELRLHTVVVEECDQCEYKTTKYDALRFHKKRKHSGAKQKCTDCEYFHVYPNRVKMHYNQVHMGKKRGRGQLKCRRELCEFAGTKNCSELESHSYFFCELCQLSFERSDYLNIHNRTIHEGLIFKCDHCDTYSTARKDSLERHIVSKHSGEEAGKLRFCQEEGCTYIDLNGGLKRHIDTKHEGIVRFKCHVMNCAFGTSQQKYFRRHARTHEKESSKANFTKPPL